jgi:DNA polymerase
MAGDDRRRELGAVAGELLAHLEWLRDAGVREVPPPALATPGVAPPTPAGTRQRTPPHTSPSPTPTPSSTLTPALTQTPALYTATDRGCGSEPLLAVRRELGECTRCPLAGGRTTLVFGVGDPRAELMFVGEGPGADEDREGEPFVGKAGQLLTRMIEAMGFRRAEVYIANVVKCRPPGNRNPEPGEIAACEPFLKAQIAAIGPRVIVALGKFAAQTLLRSSIPITRLRGQWSSYGGVRLMPTFHPAYLLRSPQEKGKAWDDLKLVMKELGRPLPGGAK